ncbi:MAG: nucleotidyltransferase domain-containing protein [Gemmatimonadaceae bacterium]
MSVQRVLERRHAERNALIARAEVFVQQLDPALGLRAAVVFGSVARGDFNRWSDVDLLLIADGFKGSALQRAGQLGDRPPLVQPGRVDAGRVAGAARACQPDRFRSGGARGVDYGIDPAALTSGGRMPGGGAGPLRRLPSGHGLPHIEHAAAWRVAYPRSFSALSA